MTAKINIHDTMEKVYIYMYAYVFYTIQLFGVAGRTCRPYGFAYGIQLYNYFTMLSVTKQFSTHKHYDGTAYILISGEHV